MDKKEEFKKMTDAVLNNISKSGNKQGEIFVGAEDLLHMLINLNQQINEQRESIGKLSRQRQDLDDKLNILIKELISLGYIRAGEKRRLFKRTILNQDALIDLLVKKKIISKRELLNRIKIEAAGQK